MQPAIIRTAEMPYIFVSPIVTSRIPDRFTEREGVVYCPQAGVHAIWAARVPFLPAMNSDDFRELGKDRIGLIMRRQFRFLYDLARVREHQTTFELRFIASPNPIPGLPSLVSIGFLAKVFASQPQRAQEEAERLWRKFVANFPSEDPFNYPLEPIVQEDAFHQFYEPIPFDDLDTQQVVEIRKWEDMPVAMPGAYQVERVGDYIVHPFVPNVDFSAMGRFLGTLSAQRDRCFVSVSLRPTRLFPQEIHNISAMVAYFNRILFREQQKLAKEVQEAVGQQTVAGSLDSDEYLRARAELGSLIYRQLMHEREQLVSVRMCVVGEYEAPLDLAEAFGSEIMGNVDNRYPTSWVLARPADRREMAIARDNLRYLEQDDWGFSITDEDPKLRIHKRLRYLATAQEAFGAFRLPIPPASGYMPGVLVKNEPFVAPADQLERLQLEREPSRKQQRVRAADTERRISLGTVYHRGNPIPQQFEIAVTDLTRHTLIAGSTGSGKSNTIRHILEQLWRLYRIPFLVLYPIDKPDYRELQYYQSLRDDLLVFTLGDESTSPFRFNPFEVPAGILLKTHLSRLMRVFESAFGLFDPLPMIYREALRRVYRKKGWNVVSDRGDPQREYPVMSEFYQEIKDVVASLKYGKEVQSNVQQASVIRIRDLLENAGSVFNVRRSMDFRIILNRPVIMELGRIGSAQDTALLMGFLLMRFAAELERNPRPAHHPHITVVEEAHRVMAANVPVSESRGQSQHTASEDFSNILAEVRGFGEGLVIAEQIPTLLVQGAIGNTYLKIMHWLEDAHSFQLFSQIMNLNPAQQEYARTLTAGFAVIRSPYGQPVHIKVPDNRDLPGYSEDRTCLSDEYIARMMEQRRRQAGIEDQVILPWEELLSPEPSAQSSSETPAMSATRQDVRDRSHKLIENKPETPAVSATRRDVRELKLNLLAAPMQSCMLCQPLANGECPHRKKFLKLPDAKVQQCRTLIEQAMKLDSDSERQKTILQQFRVAVGGNHDWQYCVLAHLVAPYFDRNRPEYDKDANKQSRTLLRRFSA